MPVPDVSQRSLHELISLEGRRAVVTGGARGIGSAVAARLHEAGASILVADVDEQAAAATARAIGRDAPIVSGAHVDMRVPSSVSALADKAVGELGGIDIWVNNAGLYPTTPLLDMSDQQWSDVLDVNLKGCFLGAQAAARQMVPAGGGGVIVNLASTTAFSAPGPGIAHYVSSKSGIRGLTKALAVELGPHDIRVLAVAPTYIDTPGTEASRAAMEARGVSNMLELLSEQMPLGRVGVADDVARVVLFCVSDLSILMTGSTVVVDAGELAR